MKYLLTTILLTLCGICAAQSPSFLGAGNDSSITVSSSPVYSDTSIWTKSPSQQHTVNGSGLLSEYFEAGRFLMQSSLGFEEYHVEEVLDLGFEEWIDSQFVTEYDSVTVAIYEVFERCMDTLELDTNFVRDRRPSWRHFNYAWWDASHTSEALLRHKVASALTQIFVVSRNSDLSGYGDGLADYYDMLADGAFGNFRDLLWDVTTHACMGHYLTHANNPKSYSTDSTEFHPDENYAREVMQLFTIGLYELNTDGTRMQINGEDVPTYDNDDIAEFAKVFTGMGYGAVEPELAPYDPYFGMGLWVANVRVPMMMYDGGPNEDQHEEGVKYLLNGDSIPDGQTGWEDIDDGLDNLFEHQNVGPFIAYRLIQRMVKSNPSPAYVGRVASKFNDDGNGVRGDMKAVIKAILMDEEARDCAYQTDVNAKLKEPFVRYTHFSRMAEKYNPNNLLWNINYGFYQGVKQDMLASPSVFNFYNYDDVPNGAILDAGLVAPEYKLHDSRTSIGYLNWAYNTTRSWGDIMHTWEQWEDRDVDWEHEDLLHLARDSEEYINWLDKHFLNGSMSDKTRKVIRQGLNSYDINNMYHNTEENRVRLGIYLALISPEYSTLK